MFQHNWNLHRKILFLGNQSWYSIESKNLGGFEKFPPVYIICICMCQKKTSSSTRMPRFLRFLFLENPRGRNLYSIHFEFTSIISAAHQFTWGCSLLFYILFNECDKTIDKNVRLTCMPQWHKCMNTKYPGDMHSMRRNKDTNRHGAWTSWKMQNIQAWNMEAQGHVCLIQLFWVIYVSSHISFNVFVYRREQFVLTFGKVESVSPGCMRKVARPAWLRRFDLLGW